MPAVQAVIKAAQPDVVEVNDLSARIARTSAAELITGLSATKKKTIRSLVARGIEQGWSDTVLQARIKQAAGLSPRDVTALENYRAGLLKAGTPPGRTSRMVDQYANRLRRARAALIARTETRQVLMDAQRSVWKRMQEAGDLSPYAVRVTRLHKDERLCAHCRSKNGQRRSLKDAGDGPPFHPNCRCWEEIVDEGILKHLPGEHDQKTHGHRGIHILNLRKVEGYTSVYEGTVAPHQPVVWRHVGGRRELEDVAESNWREGAVPSWSAKGGGFTVHVMEGDTQFASTRQQALDWEHPSRKSDNGYHLLISADISGLPVRFISGDGNPITEHGDGTATAFPDTGTGIGVVGQIPVSRIHSIETIRPAQVVGGRWGDGGEVKVGHRWDEWQGYQLWRDAMTRSDDQAVERYKAYMEAQEIIGRAVNNLKKDEPRDGDGDGWVYDGTPQMRPATPRVIHDLPAFYAENVNTWIEQYGGRVNLIPEPEPKTLQVDGPAIHYPGYSQEEVDTEYAPTLREIVESADVYGFTLTAYHPADHKFQALFAELGFTEPEGKHRLFREPKDIPQSARYDTNEVPLFDKGAAGGYLSGPRLRALLEEYRDHPSGTYTFGDDSHVEGLQGGVSASYVVRVRFKDSGGKEHDLVVKDVRNSNLAWNEDWAGSIANALGLPFDAVKIDDTRVVMPYIDGDIGYARSIPWDDPTLKGALEMAILDVLILNEDRHGGNYLLNDENQLFPIDHSYGLYNGMDDIDEGGQLVRLASHYSPFVTEALINRVPNMGKLRSLQGKIDAMTDDDMPVDVRETMRKRMRALIKYLESIN